MGERSIELLLEKDSQISKPIPKPRKSVKQMVTEYENNIIQPPIEFRDKPVPAPRTVKSIPAPRTKITKLDKALKNAVKSYEVGFKNKKRPIDTAKQH